MSLTLIWCVGLGSALGGMSRFVLFVFIQQKADTTFPVGTLLINITGSMILGFVLQYATGSATMSPEVRAFFTTGFCGGYTTFSTFSFETARLIQDGDYGRASLYVILSVAVSLAGMFAGFGAARELLDVRAGR